MYSKLINLADYLDNNNLHEDSISIKQLVKLSGIEPTSQKINEYLRPQDTRPLYLLLNALGLVPGTSEGVDLVNAALYLSEGITTTNLLLAGLSITSMVPGLSGVSGITKHGSNLSPSMTIEIARLILKHKERIKASFTKLNEGKIKNQILNYVPQGKMIILNADRMFEAVRKWAYDIVTSGIKSNVSEEQEATSIDPFPVVT